ncbi:hypothetical protein GH714_032415 [Hevea brasiliensis]|uniref:Uncharacterized protein n=1 Tax=Hevea brasiliensis TaxID=3981 RepID=A0A6A6KML5_HEVBR|nr:hypothetical protein GH714_032415 [Hevea brasiliensis]
MEVLILPLDFFKDDYVIPVPPLGTSNGSFHGLLSNALHTLYRIDVGQNVNGSDPFWRNWVGDGVFDSQIFGSTLAAPVFQDFVVQSDDSGYIRFSIGPNNDSGWKIAFLNGLEIMEFVTNTSMKLDQLEPEHPSGKHLDLVIGFSVGGVVLISILIILFLFAVRRRKAKSVQAMFLKDEALLGEERLTVG